MLNSPVDEIKNRLDIVDVIQGYIKLQKVGANYRAVCPFHQENKPSFFVSPSRQVWHCFGSCGEGGDMFKFVMKIEGVEFGDALRILAKKAGVELKKEDPKIRSERQKLYEISELACKFFETQLEKSEAGKKAKDYLLKRGISEESIKEWRLGYSPDAWHGLSDFLVSKGYKREEVEKAGLVIRSEKSGDYFDRFRMRIMFPIFNLSSQVIGFGGRVMEGSKDAAKYVNSPGTMLYDKSRVLYGLNKAGVASRKKDKCILTEGYVDVIMAHQAGFKNVVATSGTALTTFQLNILKRYTGNLLTAFDMDLAGGSATKRGIDLAQRMGFDIKIVTMPEGSDPADIIAEDPKEWEKLVEGAKSIHDFYFKTTISKFDKNTIEGKKEILKILLPVIKKIPNKVEQTHWIQSLAKEIDVKEEDLREELDKVKEGRDNTQVVEKVVEEPKRNRKDLLEEHLIVLGIKKPKNWQYVKKEDFDLLSPSISHIAFSLKDNKEPKEDLEEKINYLSLKSEIYEIPEEHLEEEFQNCLKEIRTMCVKDKLSSICKEIKKAEQEEDAKKLKELLEKFNTYSKSWQDLETS